MKAASQQIARLGPGARSIAQPNGRHLWMPFYGYRPATGSVRRSGERCAQAEALPDLLRMREQSSEEGHETRDRRLLGNGYDGGAVLFEVSSDCQQQRSGSGDDDAFVPDVIARAHQRLKAAGAKDSRQGPARERKKALARAGGEDKFPAEECLECRGALVPRMDGCGSGGIDYLASGEELRSGSGECRDRAGFRRVGMTIGMDSGSPDLAAGLGVVVQHGNALAERCRGGCGGEAGRASSNYHHVKLTTHGWVSTSMPLRHGIWQER
jgi:hypothetical protein